MVFLLTKFGKNSWFVNIHLELKLFPLQRGICLKVNANLLHRRIYKCNPDLSKFALQGILKIGIISEVYVQHVLQTYGWRAIPQGNFLKTKLIVSFILSFSKNKAILWFNGQLLIDKLFINKTILIIRTLLVNKTFSWLGHAVYKTVNGPTILLPTLQFKFKKKKN